MKYKVMHCKSLRSESLSAYRFDTLEEAEAEMRRADRLCLGAYLYEKIGNKWVFIHG
jgi:hypothetical protein